MKRLLPSNNQLRSAAACAVAGVVCLFAAGCSPRLAAVGTGGLLSRSFDNYSQSTVVRSEAVMATEKPKSGSRTTPPRKEYSREQSRTEEVISPTQYTPTATASEPANTVLREQRNFSEGPDNETVPAPRNAGGIPKVTEQAAAGMKNISFVTRQEAAPANTSGSVRAPEASTRISAVTPTLTAREQRALDKKRKEDARRLLAEREAASKTATAAPQQTASAKPQQAIANHPTNNNDDEPSVEDFLPGATSVSPAVAAAVTMPDARVAGKPVPAFINTPADEKTTIVDDDGGPGAVAPSTHNFKPNETEHVKFSYYDPFGDNNNRFVVVLNEQKFCYPYPGKFLSAYGPRGRSMHSGVDIKGIKNDTIRAAFAGTVRMSKPYSGYGNCVVIRHKNGLETLYGHNSRNLVRVGDVVNAGEPIALIGRTGRATTEHCHFEVRVQGQHINPALILDCNSQSLRAGVLSVTKQSGGRIVAANRASGLAPSQAADTDDDNVDSQSTIAAGGGETRLASTGSSAASSSNAGKNSSASSGSSSGGTGGSIHTVKSGDTLWGIARKYGTSVAKICSLNGLEREATLPLGKKLKLR